jgi:hypothetical protein
MWLSASAEERSPGMENLAQTVTIGFRDVVFGHHI